MLSTANSSTRGPNRSRLGLLHWLITTLSVGLPLAGVVGAFFWHRTVSVTLTDVAQLLVFAFLSELGVTVGYHRLFSHHAYSARPVLAFLLGVCGGMAAQGPLLFWVGVHRRHHGTSDEVADPHSPLRPHRRARGFWHSHFLWLFSVRPELLGRLARDLHRDRVAMRVHAGYPLWLALGLVLPTVLGGLLAQDWRGAVSGAFWGGLVRIAVVHQITWSVNSICHLFGSRPNATKDNSRNNLVVALLSLGEGWHNNHHASPNLPRFGQRWWQLDIGYWFIRCMEVLGLARLDRRFPVAPGAERTDPTFRTDEEISESKG